MTCPLHKVANERQTDSSVTGGSVNTATNSSIAEFAQHILDNNLAKAMSLADKTLPTPEDILRGNLPHRGWVKQEIDAVRAAALQEGAQVREIAGGYGGVAITTRDGRKLVFIPVADVSPSPFAEYVAVDITEGTVWVQREVQSGKLDTLSMEGDSFTVVFEYNDVDPTSIAGLIAASTLAHAVYDEKTYAKAVAELLREFKQGDSEGDEEMLEEIGQVAQAKVGSRAVIVTTESGPETYMAPSPGLYVVNRIMPFYDPSRTAFVRERKGGRKREGQSRSERVLQTPRIIHYSNGHFVFHEQSARSESESKGTDETS